MLRGKLVFRDEHLGSVEFNLYGLDSFNDLKLQINNDDFMNTTNYINAHILFDKGVVDLFDEEGNELEQSYIDDVMKKFEDGYNYRVVEKEVNGKILKSIIYNTEEKNNPSNLRRLEVKKVSKYKSNIGNRDFCSKIGALIRYAESQGKKNYNQGIENPEDHFKTERRVEIDGLGYIRFELGLIKELKLEGKYVSIFLIEDDNIMEEGIFKEIKEKDKYGNTLSTTPIVNVGFKLSTELLGFKYTPPVVKEYANVLGMYTTIEEVIDANPDKNTSWILDRKYVIVTDDMLDEVMKEFYDFDGWIAYDTETTGLNISFLSRMGIGDQLVGVVLSKEKGTGYYFPLQHKLFPNLCGGDHWYFMERYMKKLLETKKIIGHNTSFDWKVSYIYGINVNFMYDTMLAFGVTKRYEDPSFETSLSSLAKNIFGLDMFDLKDFVVAQDFSNSGVTFADLPYDLVKQYAPTDGDMTLSLKDFADKEELLERYGAQRIFEQEVNFAKVVGYSEFYGYRVNSDEIPQLTEEILSAMEKHKNNMFKIAGREFNPNSPKQLMEIMYDELGIEQVGPKRSTNKETLKTLAERENSDGSPKYPFVIELRAYRAVEGIFKNFLKKLHLFASDDGFIFPNVFQLGTDTGRVSVKEPNYQSYNDPVKKKIVPRDGYMHFDCDFSQIEYRVLASLAKQESLIEAFLDPDLDYHSYQASRMFAVPYASVSKSLRNQSKGINFGLPYGMGDSSLGARIFGERNDETRRKAAVLRRKFFQGQEKIEEFFQTTRDKGVAQGFTSTYFGRRRYYQKEKFTEGEIRRQAGNHVIQGTAADIYKEACCRMFNRIVSEGWLGLVLINVFVHDELLMEVHKSINPFYFFKAWREEFQIVIEGFCPLFAGAGVGHNWYEAKGQDLPVQFIEEIIDMYKPEMEWDEDVEKFISNTNKWYYEHKIRRVKEFITATENQGEVIKPNIYSLLTELVEDIVKEVSKDISRTNRYNEMLGKEKIFYDEEGKKKHKLKTLEDNLKVFCMFYNINFEEIDIKSPDDVSTSTSTQDPLDEEINLHFEDAQVDLGTLISLQGYYRDLDEDILYITNRPMMYNSIQTDTLNFFNMNGVFKTEGELQLAYYDEVNRTITKYNAFTNEEGYQLIVRTYTSLRPSIFNFSKVTI